MRYVRDALRRHTKDILRLHKKTSFWGFIWDVLTLSARRAAGSGTEGCRGRSPLRCTHAGRACKKQPCFEDNWMNFLKMLVLTLNSHYLWRYNCLKLRFFLNVSFLKYSRAEWVEKVTKKSFLLRYFWQISEMSVSIEIWLRFLRNISCRLVTILATSPTILLSHVFSFTQVLITIKLHCINWNTFDYKTNIDLFWTKRRLACILMNDFMKIFRDIHKYIHRDSRQRCSIEKLILEILQNSQENSCARVSLLKKRLRPATLSKKKLWHRRFPVNFPGVILANLLHIFFDSYSANIKNINVTTLKINVII